MQRKGGGVRATESKISRPGEGGRSVCAVPGIVEEKEAVGEGKFVRNCRSDRNSTKIKRFDINVHTYG
jgi:hypothetical protein